jgi:hypothetical protein
MALWLLVNTLHFETSKMTIISTLTTMKETTTYPEIGGPQCKGNVRISLIYNILRNKNEFFSVCPLNFKGKSRKSFLLYRH